MSGQTYGNYLVIIISSILNIIGQTYTIVKDKTYTNLLKKALIDTLGKQNFGVKGLEKSTHQVYSINGLLALIVSEALIWSNCMVNRNNCNFFHRIMFFYILI
jgi:hypothetical protein